MDLERIRPRTPLTPNITVATERNGKQYQAPGDQNFYVMPPSRSYNGTRWDSQTYFANWHLFPNGHAHRKPRKCWRAFAKPPTFWTNSLACNLPASPPEHFWKAATQPARFVYPCEWPLPMFEHNTYPSGTTMFRTGQRCRDFNVSTVWSTNKLPYFAWCYYDCAVPTLRHGKAYWKTAEYATYRDWTHAKWPQICVEIYNFPSTSVHLHPLNCPIHLLHPHDCGRSATYSIDYIGERTKINIDKKRVEQCTILTYTRP